MHRCTGFDQQRDAQQIHRTIVHGVRNTKVNHKTFRSNRILYFDDQLAHQRSLLWSTADPNDAKAAGLFLLEQRMSSSNGQDVSVSTRVESH